MIIHHHIGFNTQGLSYLPVDDISFVKDAYEYAEKAHQGIFRKDKSPYISHPLAVVEQLSLLKLDKEILAAAFLHDVIEDTDISAVEIEHLFGAKVTELVQGVTKLEKLENLHKDEMQAKNLEKMILAMTQDVRVIIIKLADRLHNMQTLDAMTKHKQYRIARETQDVYVQIAGKLGMYCFKRPLEDLAFKYLYPYRHTILQKKLVLNLCTHTAKIKQIQAEIKDYLQDNKLNADVIVNQKNISRIYKAMKETALSFDNISSVFSYSIVVNNIKHCYKVLGLIHHLYRPLPGRFKDYTASPKSNGYQSLHTKVITKEGSIIEIQILTQAMKQKASYGIIVCLLNRTDQMGEIAQKTRQWFNCLINLQQDSDTSREFYQQFIQEIKQLKIQVLTPAGDIHELPEGSSVLDFAYSIHTEIGHHAISALSNQKQVNLSHVLINGDVLQVLTNQLHSPKPNWLDWVKTSKAKINIKKALRKSAKENHQTVKRLGIEE